MQMRKNILLALAALTVSLALFADEPFRNHRYDVTGIMPVHEGDIVLMGDSITNMHEWWEAFGCRQNILNRGVSGCVSSETLKNADAVVQGHPAKVFIMVGTNDLGTSGKDVPADIASNVEAVVKAFKEGSPETEIYVQSVLPVAEGGSRSNDNIVGLNALYKGICERSGATYVDLWSKFVEPGTTHIDPSLTKDGLHLYPAGYKIWCEEIAGYIGAGCVYPAREPDDFGLPGSFAMRAAAFDMLPLDKDDIVMFGDSFVHGGEWHELLGSDRVKNRGTGWGFGGTPIDMLIKEVPAVFRSGKSPAKVYIQAGATEIYRNVPVDTIAARYRLLVDAVAAAAPGSRLYLTSPQPVYPFHYETMDQPEVNSRIAAIASETGAEYVDIYSPLIENGCGRTDYVNGNYVYGKGYLKIARILAESMGLEPVEVVYATRETAFTGRGNTDEPLVTLTVSPAGPLKFRRLAVELAAPDGDVMRLSVLAGGQVLGSVKVRPGKSRYRIPCRMLVDDLADICLCADIAEDAVEGDKVTADINAFKCGSRWTSVKAPAPGAREILLRRVKVLSQFMYGSVGYRIPAIETLRDGTLLTTADKRKFNDSDLPEDIDVVAQLSKDGGRTWSYPCTVIEGKGFGKGFGDAALVETESGVVACAFCGGPGLWASTLENPQRNYISLSSDGGLTWDKPFDCTSMLWGPEAVNPECKTYHSAFIGSGHGLRLRKGPHAGRIMFVAAVHSKPLGRFDNYAVYSDDEGKSWQVSECAFQGGDEAKVVELSDGRVLMSVRRRGERGYNISEDGGHTWGEQGLWKEICTNACNGDIINVGDSLLLQSVPNDMSRKNVSIFVSRDDGRTWPYVKSLCRYESVYSSMTVLPDGTIGAYIEENPRVEFDMYFLNFSLDWLLKKEE